MAIVTRRAQHRRDVRGRRIARHQIAHDRRIGSRRICELQQHESHGQHADNPFQNLLHAIQLRPASSNKSSRAMQTHNFRSPNNFLNFCSTTIPICCFK
jgi:hypothetical protein